MFEKLIGDIGSHTKALKVHEIMTTNLQNGIASDLNDVREQIRSDRAAQKTEIADARASATRACAQNDAAIQSVASEIGALKQFRELFVERLHIEKMVNQVRDWQTGHIPQITSAVKDLEERCTRVQRMSQKDHEIVQALQKSAIEVRQHFKMFHAIASGLDDKPAPPAIDIPAAVMPDDSRLPPAYPSASPR